MALLYFIGLIVLVFFLAKFIINYIPKKLHWLISLLLLAISGFLAYLIYDGIVGNIEFHQEKKEKYAKVIDHLKIIRDAENAYKKGKGTYTGSFDKLVRFIESDSIAITQTREEVKMIEVRGVMVPQEYKVIDTIGFNMVARDFKDVNYKDMMNVPGTSTKFDLKSGFVVKGVTETKMPVFEAKISKKVVLADLEYPKLIAQEITATAIDEVRGEFISVGTMEDVKDSGNWPPSYDIEKKDSK